MTNCGRFVPFAAVAAANAINIPMMRSNELKHGIPVLTEEGEKLGESAKAAQSAISQVTVLRVKLLYNIVGQNRCHFGE